MGGGVIRIKKCDPKNCRHVLDDLPVKKPVSVPKVSGCSQIVRRKDDYNISLCRVKRYV